MTAIKPFPDNLPPPSADVQFVQSNGWIPAEIVHFVHEAYDSDPAFYESGEFRRLSLRSAREYTRIKYREYQASLAMLIEAEGLTLADCPAVQQSIENPQ